MKWFIFVLLILISFFQTKISAADTFDPPWKVINRNSGFEYWYDSSRIEVTPKHVSTYIWEVYPKDGRSTYKYIVFERETGWWAYGKTRGYRGEMLITEIDFAQFGYRFQPPRKVDKKLFNVLKKVRYIAPPSRPVNSWKKNNPS